MDAKILSRETAFVWIAILCASGMFLMGQEAWSPPPPCSQDMYEQNDSFSEAYDLGAITDCDAALFFDDANIEPAYDDDWFKVHVSDELCPLEAILNISGVASGEIYEICIDYYCDSSSTPSIPDASECLPTDSSGSGGVDLDVNCIGFDDSGTAYISVIPQTGGACGHYILEFLG